MFTILDYSSALEYSIIRRYTNIVYYYSFTITLYTLLYTEKQFTFQWTIIFKEEATLYNLLHMTHSVTVKDNSHSLQ